MATYRKTFSYLSQYTLRVVATEASTNQMNNTSNVNVKMYIDKASGTGYWLKDSFSAYIEINGSRQNYTINGYDFRGRSTIKIAERTLTVKHNNDGGKSCSIKGHVNAAQGSGTIGTATASGSLGLTKFNRKGYIREFTREFSLTGNNGFRLHERSKGLNFKVTLQKRDGSKSYQTWTITPGWNNIAVSAGTRNNLYNDFTGTGEFLLRIRLYSYVGSSLIGTTNYHFQTRPQGLSVSSTGTITIGNSASVSFTKRHTDARFEYGLRRRNGGAWLPGYPKTTTGSSASLSTSSASIKEAILALNPSGSYTDVGVWVKQMNSKGRNLGTTERNLRINFRTMTANCSVSNIRRTKAVVNPSFGTVTTSVSTVQYQVNGGSWQSGSTSSFTISGLKRNASNTVRIRAQQKGSNIWAYSGTKTFTTIGESSLSVNKSSGEVGSTFLVSVVSPPGTSSELTIKNSNGKTIYGPTTVAGATTREMTFDYKDLVQRGVNDTSYKDELSISIVNKDSDGVTSNKSTKFTYHGGRLPNVTTSPSKTTSQGLFTVTVSAVDPRYSVTVEAFPTNAPNRKFINQIFTGSKSIVYNFKDDDFDDLFESGNIEDVEISVTAVDRGTGHIHYSISKWLKVEQHSEVFVRHKGKWHKIEEIHTMQTGVGKILYPYIFNYPGKETYLRGDVAAKAELSENTYVYIDKWVRII